MCMNFSYREKERKKGDTHKMLTMIIYIIYAIYIIFIYI